MRSDCFKIRLDLGIMHTTISNLTMLKSNQVKFILFDVFILILPFLINVFYTTQYSRNTAKVALKHQSINHPMCFTHCDFETAIWMPGM